MLFFVSNFFSRQYFVIFCKCSSFHVMFGFKVPVGLHLYKALSFGYKYRGSLHGYLLWFRNKNIFF